MWCVGRTLRTRTARYPEDSRHILVCMHFLITRLRENPRHRRALVIAMFEQQPAAGGEVVAGCGGDVADVIQAAGAGGEGGDRFEADFGGVQTGVFACDIRGVRNDQIENFSRERFQPDAFTKLDIADAQPRGVAAGHSQGGGGAVGGDDPAGGAFARDGQRDGARSGAEVGDAPGAAGGDALQSELHQQLGFGARDECGGRDLQLHRPEFAPSREVGERFACGAACDQRVESRHGFVWQEQVGPGMEMDAIAVQHETQQGFGVEARGVAYSGKAVRRFIQDVGDGGVSCHERRMALY